MIRDVNPVFHWSRWDCWQANDPRWNVPNINTSGRSFEEVSQLVASWVQEQRDLFLRGELPLSGKWWDDRSYQIAIK